MIGKFLALSSLLLASANGANTPFATKVAQTKNTKKASHISRLLSKATPTRRLDEEEEWEIDLSGYSIKFVKCQFIKAYDEEMAQEAEAETVMRTDRFIIFRLCPSSSCAYNYGEYLIDMETYLQSAVEYEQQQRENMCQYCEEVCAADDDAARRQLRRLDDLKVSCDTCVDECAAYEDMEENGYIDATNFIECQQVAEDDDDGGNQYFVGALCASGGSAIKLGVFLDEECSIYDSSLSVEKYLNKDNDNNNGGFTISYDLLKQTYSTASTIPCVEPDWEVPEEEDENGNQDDAAEEEEEEVEINQMCMELYEGAAKCEEIHGFEQHHLDDEFYSIQAAQEDLVCQFISTIGSGSYDQSGNIVLNSRLTIEDDAQKTTGGQAFMLTVLIVGTVGFAYYAMTLHSALMKNGEGLSSQGGAVA